MILDKRQADAYAAAYARIETGKDNAFSTTAKIFPATARGKYRVVNVGGDKTYLYGEINGETYPLMRGFEMMLITEQQTLQQTGFAMATGAPSRTTAPSRKVIERARRDDPLSKALLSYHATGLTYYFNQPLEILAGRMPAKLWKGNFPLWDILFIRDPREDGVGHLNMDRILEMMGILSLAPKR